jgi:hypothetical protein
MFDKCISDDFLNIEKMKSSEYINYCWRKYEKFRKDNPQDNSMNGNIFELIIISEMYRQSICPMFLRAQAAFVPNVNFDILLYSSKQVPVGLSLKTSLRERYKQADLEAVALKYVHRQALNYLITLDEKEAKTAKNKVEDGTLLGLDDIIIATDNEFNLLIDKLKNMKFVRPEKVDIIKAGTVIVKNE